MEEHVNLRERHSQSVMAEGAKMGTTRSKRLEDSVDDVTVQYTSSWIGRIESIESGGIEGFGQPKPSPCSENICEGKWMPFSLT